MLEPVGTGQPFPRAFLRIGGASLAQHQLGAALELDCQRVICLARGTSAELLAVQHATEAAGLKFHIATDSQQLSGLVTATDELLIFTEGLFAEPAYLVPLMRGPGALVLSLPDDGAVAEGFERLDINNAAAGVIKVPGSMIERLHDLPPDCDTASALTRIALQSGMPMRQVPPEARSGGIWRMVRNDGDALAIEGAWLRDRLALDSSPTLSGRLARKGVLSFGSSLLHAGNASGAMSLAVLIAVALALGAAWFGWTVLAFAIVGLAWVLSRATELLRRAERHAHGVARPAIPRADALGWIVDLALIAICVTGVAVGADASVAMIDQGLFAPLMLVLMLHLAPRLLADGLAAWTCDRAALALVLGVAAAVGHLGIAVRLLAVVLTLAAIVLPPRRQT